MTPSDTATMLAGYAIFFAFGLAWGLSLFRKEKTRKARTCGTCAFCSDIGTDGRNGCCTRRPYPTNPTYDSGNPNFPQATRALVELHWPGCGESEEKRR